MICDPFPRTKNITLGLRLLHDILSTHCKWVGNFNGFSSQCLRHITYLKSSELLIYTRNMLQWNDVFFINIKCKWGLLVWPFLFQSIVLETSLNSHLPENLVSEFSKIQIRNFLLFYRSIIIKIFQNFSSPSVSQWISFDPKPNILYDKWIFVHVTAEYFFEL
jgi:hypothetical protein